ncbi:carbonic anhydrase [Planosporangium sp. 12N6]|uniref:carbonic anhydrase n=1 Tax=Planosporangium spinosum TaxID=3402278 RepID=UPI003CF91B48
MIGSPRPDESPSAAAARAAAQSPPDLATPLAELLAGNQRFAAGRPRFGHRVDAPRARTPEHRPWALVVGCLDSRVPPEAVLDQDFGSIVVVRTGGHVLDEAGLGSVEFCVAVFGVPLVLVLGHQYCGAVGATVDAVDAGTRPEGPMRSLVDEIAPSVDRGDPADRSARVDRAVDRHISRTVSALSELAVVRDRLAAGALEVVGARYQVDTGQVRVLGR